MDYVVSGSVQRRDKRLTVSVELVETRTARIVWAEVFNQTLDDAFQVLDEIGNRIVASIASEIETIERNRAILRPPNSLDAWEAHHRGLWHMYRFSRADNERAQHFFETAIRLDPTFARAYAGLSFTHFQNAFQGWTKRGPEVDRAFEAAGQSLMADDRDPAAHWAMGRALWLRGEHDQSVAELEQAVDLSPNFALAHYNLAFVHSTAGDSQSAISRPIIRAISARSIRCCSACSVRARWRWCVLKRFDEAAEWGIKAAARPNAHAHIKAIAAYSLALAGRIDEGARLSCRIRKTLPRYGGEGPDHRDAIRCGGHGAVPQGREAPRRRSDRVFIEPVHTHMTRSRSNACRPQRSNMVNDPIAELTRKISELQAEVDAGIARRRAELRVGLEHGRVVFEAELLRRHRELKTALSTYILECQIRW